MRIAVLFVSSVALLGTAEARNKKAAKAAPPPPTEEAAATESAAEPAPAAAPESPRAKIIGVDGGLALPVGTWGDGAGFGIGALARFEMPINEKLTFGARAGYIQHLSKDGPSAPGGGGSGSSSSAHEIPFLAGVRYGFTKTPTTELYGAAELGLVVYGVSVDYMGMSQSNSDTNFGMTLTGGYKTGKLDIRGGLFLPDLGHAGDAIGIMASVGYDITTL